MDNYITRTSLRRRRKDYTATGTETNGIHQSTLHRGTTLCRCTIPFKTLRCKTMVCSRVNHSCKRMGRVCITHKPMPDSTLVISNRLRVSCQMPNGTEYLNYGSQQGYWSSMLVQGRGPSNFGHDLFIQLCKRILLTTYRDSENDKDGEMDIIHFIKIP